MSPFDKFNFLRGVPPSKNHDKKNTPNKRPKPDDVNIQASKPDQSNNPKPRQASSQATRGVSYASSRLSGRPLDFTSSIDGQVRASIINK